MKSHLALAFALVPLALARSGPLETTILAAMKLSEEPNYSWTSTVIDDARTYEIRGKSEKNGYTWQRLPMIKPVACRLGRDADTVLEAIFRDANRFVIRTNGGWKKLEELPQRHPDWVNQDDWWVTPMSPPMAVDPLTGDFIPLDPFHWPAVIFYPAPPTPNNGRSERYTNAQLALARPHDELAVIVSSYESMHVDDHVATGTLTDLGAQLLLVREGQTELAPVMAAGGFRLWLQNGTVAKYTVELAGILLVGGERTLVRQKSHTVLREIGMTHVEVPYEVRRKLRG